ncbi:MAG: ankyrin repeat domain-containing protein [Planctomycetes bacterium]|nr:ankyrin repeat domain-containing protein [Planctomycetota bacterium]
MSDANDRHELIERHLRGELSEAEKERLAELLDSDPSARKDFVEQVQWDTQLAEVLRENGRGRDSSGEPNAHQNAESGVAPPIRTPSQRTPTKTFTRTLLAIAAVVIVALTATLFFKRPSPPRPIAKITGLSGSLQWTGDGGRVVNDLSVGTEMSGGTVEGMTPGSWFELEFTDGSTVTISGNSMLTFSDHGQKKLHLKEGNVSGNVRPQPAGKPMLIYTRSAMLEILGTQFEVEAGLSATVLNVAEGEVRVKRLSDGRTVDVPAKHRVVAGADHELTPVPVPDSVNRWKSQLHLGPDGSYGKWSPGTDTEDATLRAVPYTTSWGKTIYAAGCGVSRGDKPPVILQPGSRFRVRGRIASTCHVFFGVTVRHPSGEFAGKFQTVRPAAEFQGGQEFEVVLDLRDFRLDPTLVEIKSKLPSAPFDLVVESMWCHTLYEPAGLEIAEVELLPPETSPAGQATGKEPPQAPSVDIWTAASQGNLRGVASSLAAGADVDIAFIAPGVPASGATPLHLAVLFDRGEIAEFLIKQGANIEAKAKDEYGGTPLHWAAALGRIEMAKRLIDAGANINSEDDHGFTPLDATAYNRESEKDVKREIAELLREKGGRSVNESP